MAAIDDPKTFGRARLSFADQHDIDEFLATLEKFERPGTVNGGPASRTRTASLRNPMSAMGSISWIACLPSLTCFHTLVGPCAAGAVSATFTSTKRAPSSPIPTRPDTEVGGEKSGCQTGIYRGQQDPADPLGHYAFGLGGGSS